MGRMNEQPQHRRARFGRLILAFLWAISAVLLAGIVLSYLLPHGDRFVTFAGPTHAIVDCGTLAIGGGIELTNEGPAIRRLSPMEILAGGKNLTNCGIPHFWQYVGFHGPGGVWHFDLSLWCLFGLATAMAALGTLFSVTQAKSSERRMTAQHHTAKDTTRNST